MKKLLCLSLLGLVGCMNASAGDQYRSRDYQARPSINASLVKDEKALLSEEAIRALLTSRIRLPDKFKLAVLPLGHAGSFGDARWGISFNRAAEFPQEKKAYLEALEAPLAQTGRFTEITHLPSMMLPTELTLTRLREAAALMQAEVLLVYSTQSHLVTWESIWVKDEVRALASLELLLLDVRTGVVPYAETFDDEHLEKEKSGDLSIVELQRRAERLATLKVMSKAAEGLKRFMTP
ncbi:MAG TPA: hypothetical protein VJU16_07470 [Planctomycetota bacterium]|nr:hypothetical protein [Planctomycetota bacterium]